jgi:hypothetical protein
MPGIVCDLFGASRFVPAEVAGAVARMCPFAGYIAATNWYVQHISVYFHSFCVGLVGVFVIGLELHALYLPELRKGFETYIYHIITERIKNTR